MSDSIRSRFPQASASFLARNPQLSTTAKTKPVKSKTTTTDIAAHDPHDVTGSNHASKPRIRQKLGEKLNKTEAEFLEYLQLRYGCPRDAFGVQNVTLEIANGCRYTPDFSAFGILTEPTFWETKGFMRDDAAVKIKVAARAFPACRFYLCTKRAKKLGGGWDIQEVMP